MDDGGGDDPVADLVAEQLDYYRRRAGLYHRDLYDPGSPMAPYGAMLAQLEGVLDRLGVGRAGGSDADVLELACGTGAWTELLVRRCRSVLAVDGAPEMLAFTSERVPEATYVQADLLDPAWTPPPDRRFDAVFFGFWLSHVPLDRFERFWSVLRPAVADGGSVAFVDTGPADAVNDNPDGPGTAWRRLPAGGTARIVKVFHEPPELVDRLGALGWDADVSAWGEFFYAGVARPR